MPSASGGVFIDSDLSLRPLLNKRPPGGLAHLALLCLEAQACEAVHGYSGEGASAALATVSVDGLTGLRLKAEQGEVREPAWGPFVQ